MDTPAVEGPRWTARAGVEEFLTLDWKKVGGGLCGSGSCSSSEL